MLQLYAILRYFAHFTFPLRPFTLLYATLLYFTVFRHIGLYVLSGILVAFRYFVQSWTYNILSPW